MSAVISADGKYRYHLARVVDTTRAASICFVMLNPSTADAELDDPTIRRCAGFARKFRCGILEVVNLFAYRATDPDTLYGMRRETAIGRENDAYIRLVTGRAELVVCAWGNHGELFNRGNEVLAEIYGRAQITNPPFALKINKSTGQPAHPLYLPLASELLPLEPAGTGLNYS